MSDNLVERLRDRDHIGTPTEERKLVTSAADRIEQLAATCEELEAKLSKSEALLAKAMEIIEVVETFADRALWKVIKDKVSELKGETDE